MTPSEYLEAILREQTLLPGPELQRLERHRVQIEGLLQATFGTGPRILIAGSKAKGTMIKAAYDLDLAYYFPHDDRAAGDTLKEIHENVSSALSKSYDVTLKTSAIRLKDRNDRSDLHVDVVPGRFVDDDDGDVYLHQEAADKDWLKTNIAVHVTHVRDSGVLNPIKLFKLWNAERQLGLKTFVLELLVIKLLRTHIADGLPQQMVHVLSEFRDHSSTLAVEDPANPTGNDLSGYLKNVKPTLQVAARDALTEIGRGNWQVLFGGTRLPIDDKADVERLHRVAAAVSTPAKPWSNG